ncbi:hypothetical protein AB0B97_00685 [Micromonospora sp. NPDC049004]|uniref:hypothetical protein n=1 Tax=Micromonospora sp. NPDC049004 TaxID=3154348 RepID=UPI0033FDCAA2
MTMLLADWHFCCSIRLQPSDTRAYLSLLEVLRSPHARSTMVQLAAGRIATIERLQQVYAIPALVDAARRCTDAATAEHLAAALTATIGPEAPPALVHLLRRLGAATEQEIVEALSAVPVAPPATGPAQGTRLHLDLPGRATDVAVLALLRSAAEAAPRAVAAHLEQQPDYVEAVLDGELGRLPQLIAMEAAGASGTDGAKLVARLLGTSGNSGLAQPDVLETMARLLFAARTADGRDTATVVADIEREAVGFRRLDVLHRRVGGPPRADAFAWLRGEPEPLLGRLLWQTVLWQVAAEVDPASLATRLSRWWNAPPFAGPKRGKGPARVWLPCDSSELKRFQAAIGDLLRLRMPPGAEAGEIEVRSGDHDRMPVPTASLLFSPWLHRRDAVFNPMAVRDQAEDGNRRKHTVADGTFPHLGDKSALVRLFGAISVAGTLLAATGPQPPAYLVDLMVHAADVLGGYRLRTHLGNRESLDAAGDDDAFLNGPMTGLALYTQDFLRRIGSGEATAGADGDARPSLPPALVAERLRQTVRYEPGDRGKRLVGTHPQQALNLFQEAATMVVTHWAYEAYSGQVDVPVRAASAAWYAGTDGPTPAEQMIALAMTEMWQYNPATASRRLLEPATLALEAFPSLFDAVNRAEWDWLDSFVEGRKVGTRQVLLAPNLKVDEWQRVTIPEPGPLVTVDLAMMTLRLEALLADGRAVGEHADWIAEWSRRVSRLNEPKNLPRDIRRRMLDLLDVPVAEQNDATVRQVQELVIDAVAEFSVNAPRYLDLLVAKLTGVLPIGESTTAKLRQRLFRALLNSTGERAATASPWSGYAQSIGAAQRTQLLERFVARVGMTTGQPLTTSPAQWQFHRGGALVPAAATQAYDPRLVAAVLQHGYELAQVPMNVSLTTFGSYRIPRGDAVDLFAADARREERLPAGRAWVSGIVAAAERRQNERRVLVNCGLGGSPPGFATNLSLEIGDLVAVQLDSGTIRAVERLHTRPPAPDEVRKADFTIRADVVSLAVAGQHSLRTVYQHRRGISLPALVHDYWDPDISASYHRSTEVTGSTMVRWDEEHQVWLPTDRSFAHFLSAELTAAAPATTVVLIERVMTHGGEAWRVCTSPGAVYLLAAAVWTPAARARLADWRLARQQREELDGSGGETDDNGLLIHVRLGGAADGHPQLDLADEPPAGSRERWRDLAPGPFDDRNLRWRQMFATTDVHVATWNGTEWTMSTGIPEIAESVVIRSPLDGGASRSMAFELYPHSWNSASQRTGVVRGRTTLESRLDDFADPGDRFASLRYVQEGDVFDIKPVNGRDVQASLKGHTLDGLPVEIDFDSLTMDATLADGLAAGRTVVVRSIRTRPADHRQDPVPVSTEVLESTMREADRGRLTQLEGPRRNVAGLAARVLYGATRDVCGVWLEDHSGDAFYCEAPMTAFSALPRRPGDPVWAVHHAGGWSFEATPRLVNVRALWSTRFIGSDQVTGTALYLGTTQLPPVAIGDLIQRTETAEVLIATPGRTTRRHLEALSGRRRLDVPPGAGRVESTWEFPDGGTRRSRVRLRLAGNRYLYGQADVGAFGRTGDSWADLRITAEPHDLADGTSMVDIRRTFLPGRWTVRTAPDRSNDDHRLRDRFEAWEQGSNRHVTGRLRGVRAELDGLHVPLHTADSAVSWTAEVPLPATDTPWVPGRDDYLASDARFLLSRDPSTQQWQASYRDAAPLTVEQLARRLGHGGGSAGTARFPRRMYFAGLDESGAYRFEWGYGWTVLAPANCVRAGSQYAPSLFYGDRVEAVSFERVTGDDGAERLVLAIDPADLWWEIEHQIWSDDAKAVQLVTAVVDPVARTVDVRSAMVRNDRMTSGSQLSPAARERRLRNARFDRASVERIIAALPAAARDSTQPYETTLLAEVDRGAQPSADQPYLSFSFLTPNGGRERGLRPGHRVLMESGRIQRGGFGDFRNDIYVSFRFSDDVLGAADEPIEVRVYRRYFSYREATLRNALERQEANEPTEVPSRMWVSLDRSPNGTSGRVWRGDTILVPPRRSETLNTWLAAHSTAVFATVGKTWPDGRVVVELSPGVLAQLVADSRTTRGLQKGDIVTLRWAGDRVVVTPAVSADASFVDGAGRPATLLPMDNLLRRPAEYAQNGGTFTVVSLPNQPVQGGRHTASLMSRDHPKLAVIKAHAGGKAVIDATDGIRAATVGVDGDDQPVLTAVSADAPEPPPVVGWHRLSFADRPTSRIARHCRAGRWQYHDLSTGSWTELPDGGLTTRAQELPARATPANDPLFFDDRWSLRYHPEDLRRYAYPAIQLIEDGAAGQVRTFPVAGVLDGGHGIWVELAPGRVVEVPGSILRAPGTPTSLEKFCWRDVSPGDEVTLRTVMSSPLALKPLDLVAWSPGPRGYLGRNRALLVVTGHDVEAGSITLAGGNWQLTYPADGDLQLRLPVGSYCWLDRDNELTPATAADLPERGDVLLVTWRSGEVSAAGLPHLRCEPAELTTDNRTTWLSEALSRPADRARILDAVGGYLPVRVLDRDGTTARVTPVTARTASTSGQIVQLRVLGGLGNGQVLAQHGRALLSVELKAMLPGLPGRLAPDVIAWLRDSRTPVWMHVDTRQRLLSGARATAYGTDARVEPMTVVGDETAPEGIVCRDTSSLALRWLPAQQCSWATGLTASALRTAIVEHHTAEEPLHVVVRDNATVSVTMTPDAAHRRAQLTPGSAVRAVLIAPLQPLDDLHRRYLARLYPEGQLAELVSEGDLRVGADAAPMPMLVTQRSVPQRTLSLVQAGKQRTRLDICGWMAESLGGTAVPARFAAYVDAGSAPASRPVVEPEYEADLAVLREFGAQERSPGAAPAPLPALVSWLEKYGPALFDGATRPAEIDLAPALAAVLLLRRLGQDGNGLASRQAVHLTRRLGACAARSLHLGPLAKYLHDPSARATAGGQLERLTAVDLRGLDVTGKPDLRFAGSLRENQVSELKAFCRGVIGRSAGRVAEQDVVKLAAALLAAVGDAEYADLLIGVKDWQLTRLAALGRALTPNTVDFVAQPHLEEAQARLLRRILQRTLGDGLPTTMLVAPYQPIDDRERDYARRLLDWMKEAT